MPTIITAGAISANGYGFLASKKASYVEDVFSTYLYTGNGSTQTITNGIDLAGKGGLVWCKSRSTTSYDHLLFDTLRGVNQSLNTTLSVSQQSTASSLTAFNGNGFSLGSAAFVNGVGGGNFVGWTFRKQAKFFDFVTWTGTGANRTIAHSLGSVPGAIIVKRTDAAANWQVYHRSLANTEYLVLNSSAGKATGATRWNSTAPTADVFSVGTDASVNANGGTYVAYLFAHDAGGFGDADTDNVISCGSFTTDGGGAATVTLGYEPQWLLVKQTSADGDSWRIVDNMRAMSFTQSIFLYPNDSNADTAGAGTIGWFRPSPTGFAASSGLAPSSTYAYIAIRRGPMRVPTLGTSVFSPIASSAAAGTKLTTNFPVDLQIYSLRTGTTNKGNTVDRLRGVSSFATESGAQLITNSTGIETTNLSPTRFWDNTGFQMPTNFGGTSTVFWNFRRAFKCFEMVGYTGSGVNRTVSHNLGVVPELMIVKRRSTTAGAWQVYSAALANTEYLVLNTTAAKASGTTRWNSTTPTSSVFTVGTDATVNASTATYIAYLFASLAGVSKVGTYTGTGATQQIDCGFTGGARFVLIKRTDTTGDWYVWDSARGIVAGNDPYLLLNSTAAEVTNTDYIDAYSAGFEISSTAPAGVNANSGTFIYLAIA